MSSPTRRGAATAFALALAVTSCAGASSADTTTIQPASTPEPVAAAALSAAPELPAVDVISLATGETAKLTTFSRPGATLVWFWAPN